MSEKTFIVEEDFHYDSLRCVVVGTEMGHRCGYVALPEGHEHYGKGYDDIDVRVHGGLTYARNGDREYPVETEEKFQWIGFDCAHCDDAPDPDLMSEDMWKLEREFPKTGTIRTKEFVRSELVHLVDQLNGHGGEE